MARAKTEGWRLPPTLPVYVCLVAYLAFRFVRDYRRTPAEARTRLLIKQFAFLALVTAIFIFSNR